MVAKLGELRGLLVVPEWFELDDADFVDVLNELRDEEDTGAPDRADDYRR